MNTLCTTERLLPAEWVLPGHPDKLADTIADELVKHATHKVKPAGMSSVEVAINRDTVYLTGRITLRRRAYSLGLDQLRPLVTSVIESAGFKTDGLWKPFGHQFRVEGNLLLDEYHPGEAQSRLFSDDQCVVTGYAINSPGTDYLPPEHWFARTLAKNLYRDVHSPFQLCPDGKVLIQLKQTMQGGSAVYELDSVSASLIAPPGTPDIALRRVLLRHLEETLSQAYAAFKCSLQLPSLDKVILNSGGNFTVGGPMADNGLSGKKLLLDFYGPRVPIGGGALCGKDLKKSDRAGAYIARWLALDLVNAGVANEVLVNATVVPGATHLTVSSIMTPQGYLKNPEQYAKRVDTQLANVHRDALIWRLVEGSRWGYWFDGAAALNFKERERA